MVGAAGIGPGAISLEGWRKVNISYKKPIVNSKDSNAFSTKIEEKTYTYKIEEKTYTYKIEEKYKK